MSIFQISYVIREKSAQTGRMKKSSSERRIVARLVRKIVLNCENHTFKSLRKHKVFVVEGFFEKLLETLLLAVGFFAGFVFGYFVELFGQITFTITLQLWLKAIFAEILDGTTSMRTLVSNSRKTAKLRLLFEIKFMLQSYIKILVVPMIIVIFLRYKATLYSQTLCLSGVYLPK